MVDALVDAPTMVQKAIPVNQETKVGLQHVFISNLLKDVDVGRLVADHPELGNAEDVAKQVKNMVDRARGFEAGIALSQLNEHHLLPFTDKICRMVIDSSNPLGAAVLDAILKKMAVEGVYKPISESEATMLTRVMKFEQNERGTRVAMLDREMLNVQPLKDRVDQAWYPMVVTRIPMVPEADGKLAAKTRGLTYMMS